MSSNTTKESIFMKIFIQKSNLRCTQEYLSRIQLLIAPKRAKDNNFSSKKYDITTGKMWSQLLEKDAGERKKTRPSNSNKATFTWVPKYLRLFQYSTWTFHQISSAHYQYAPQSWINYTELLQDFLEKNRPSVHQPRLQACFHNYGESERTGQSVGIIATLSY